MKPLLSAAFVAVSLLGASFGQAATLTAEYSAETAFGESYSPGRHAVWLSNGVTDAVGPGEINGDARFQFIESGTFRLYDDDSATLTGRLTSLDNANAFFDIELNFESAAGLDTAPVFQSSNGSVFNPDDGFFLNMTGGSLFGAGDLAGLNLGIEMNRGVNGTYAAQFGSGVNGNTVGASGKNPNFGLAMWFDVTSVELDLTTCIACDDSTENRLLSGRGDVNVDLLPTMPLPGGALLLLSGMGLVVARRKFSKT